MRGSLELKINYFSLLFLFLLRDDISDDFDGSSDGSRSYAFRARLASLEISFCSSVII